MHLLRLAILLVTYAISLVSVYYGIVLAGAAGDPEEEPGAGPSMLADSKTHLDQCGVWVAPSTLPGAGLGMFAGKDFEKSQPMLATGDIVIPIVDIMMHQRGRKKFIFLWDEYTWVSSWSSQKTCAAFSSSSANKHNPDCRMERV